MKNFQRTRISTRAAVAVAAAAIAVPLWTSAAVASAEAAPTGGQDYAYNFQVYFQNNTGLTLTMKRYGLDLDDGAGNGWSGRYEKPPADMVPAKGPDMEYRYGVTPPAFWNQPGVRDADAYWIYEIGDREKGNYYGEIEFHIKKNSFFADRPKFEFKVSEDAKPLKPHLEASVHRGNYSGPCKNEWWKWSCDDPMYDDLTSKEFQLHASVDLSG